MTDKGFERQIDFLEGEGRTAYPMAKTEKINLPANTHDPETGAELRPTLEDSFMEKFQERFEGSTRAEVSPERRALAETRMREFAEILAEKSFTFVEYLKKMEIPYYVSVNDITGRKIICISLEDIAESDMKRH